MSSRLYEYNTIVSDFPTFLGIKCMCKQWIPGSLFHSPLGMKLSEVAHSLDSNYGHCQDQQSYRSLIHNRSYRSLIHNRSYRSLIHNRATGHSFTTGMVRTKLCYHTLAMPCHTQLTSTSVSSSGSPSRVPPSPSPPSPLPTREMVCGRSLHRSRKLDLCTQKPAPYITGGCMFLWRHQN